MKNLGKRVYKTKSTRTIKSLALVSIVVLISNLYLQTFHDPTFLKHFNGTFSDVWRFHIRYPYDLLSYLFFILGPSIYYGFIRGNKFYENGVVLNRGLPWYNRVVPYSDIKSFEVIHATLMVAIKLKHSEKKYVFGVSDVDRVLSIFDKNNVSGDLEDQDTIKLTINSMIMIFFLLMGFSVAIGQTGLNLSRYLFR